LPASRRRPRIEPSSSRADERIGAHRPGQRAIQAAPTLMIIKGGQVIARQAAPALHTWIERSLRNPAEVCDDSSMSMGDAGPARDLVFVSYSHQDRELLRRLLVLLDPVVRNRRLQVWADEYILSAVTGSAR
jgi:hypothetical protein